MTFLLAALAALSGLLSFLADHPVGAWPLAAVALVPMIVALARTPSAGRAALAGTIFGIAYHAPLVVVLKLPWQLAAPLALALTALWVCTWLGVFFALRAGTLRAAVWAGAAAALVEWASVTLIPGWGTAQSFVRTWSAAPAVMQVAALGGVTALVFVVVAWQTLLARLLVGPGPAARLRAGVAAAVLALAVLVPGWLRVTQQPPPAVSPPTLRVAAIGWRTAEAEAFGPRGSPAPTLRIYERELSRAVAAGARLVVSPEAAFVLEGGALATTMAELGDLARRHGVSLAVGYFDADRRENRAALFGPDGARAADYHKTHLVPLLERSRPGDGQLAAFAVDGVPAGAMICQDDNFQDLARGYGRRAAALVAVPTADWPEVAPFHFENSRFRAVEGGYGVVRAASDGTSAITDARGRVLGQRDHLRDGAGVVIADLPLPNGRTPFAVAGGLVPLLWAGLLAPGLAAAGAAALRSRRRGRAAAGARALRPYT